MSRAWVEKSSLSVPLFVDFQGWLGATELPWLGPLVRSHLFAAATVSHTAQPPTPITARRAACEGCEGTEPYEFLEWSPQRSSDPTTQLRNPPQVKSTPSSRQPEFRSSIPALSNSGIRDHRQPQIWLTADTYVPLLPDLHGFRMHHDFHRDPSNRRNHAALEEPLANDGNNRMPRRRPS